MQLSMLENENYYYFVHLSNVKFLCAKNAAYCLLLFLLSMKSNCHYRNDWCQSK